jgi:ABC-type antimicrobial peptide transport system permease subunit
VHGTLLRETIWLGAAGPTIGLTAAWGVTRDLESFLFGLKPRDPAAMLLAAGMLVAALVSAGYDPAMRASRIDPLPHCGTSTSNATPRRDRITHG